MTSVRNATATTVRGPDLLVTGVRNDTATTVCGPVRRPLHRRRTPPLVLRRLPPSRLAPPPGSTPTTTQPAKIDTVYDARNARPATSAPNAATTATPWCRRLGPGANSPTAMILLQ